ncbi:MAG: TIGR03663 family protein [Dehalococcoidia bacterium]|nr:TIGR03663 family protein [Dehalococcoidia bacterium]
MSTDAIENLNEIEAAGTTAPVRSFLNSPPWNGELLFYISVIVAGAVLRLWDLGSRALHHDESLHAVYSWYLYSGTGYKHDPLMHGPFKFEASSLIYFLFGDSDYTSRLLSVIMGTALIALPYLLRDYIGRYGSMFAALLLCLSPTMLYYSRFIRDDIFIAFWNLLLVIACWRYERSKDSRYLYLAAATLAASFATKEDTYITVAVFGLYLFATTAKEVLPRVVRGVDLKDVSARSSIMLLIGTLTLPQGAAAISVLGPLLPFLKLSKETPASDPAAVVITLALILASAAIGLRWNRNEWAKCALIFYGTYILLFTAFFTNLPGFSSGIWGSLHYWLAQQDVQRGGQPWYYYLVLLPIYEFLPLGMAVIGGAYLAISQHRSYLPSVVRLSSLRSLAAWVRSSARTASGPSGTQDCGIFLGYWFVASLAVYSWAGEKMPWMLVQISLPLIIIASKFLGSIFEDLSWSDFNNEKVLTLLAVLVCSPVWLPAIIRVGNNLPDSWPIFLRGWGILILLAALVLVASWSSLRSIGPTRTAQSAIVALFVLMFVVTFRTTWRLSYFNGDIPVEMLVYTQTSPELLSVKKDIERLAFESGQGKDLRITVDSSDGFTWPWAWYLRDYKNVKYLNLDGMSAPADGAVLLLSSNNVSAARPFLDRYGEGQQFKHRWWFPEDYRNLTWDGLSKSLTSSEEWVKKWDYFLFRKLSAPLGSSNAIAFFPKGFERGGLVSNSGGLRGAQDSAQGQLAASYPPASLVIGGPGIFDNPRDIALDSLGNLYVVDGRGSRVVKYDPSGRQVGQVGRQGAGDGEFTDPWGIAVDRTGNVYVADTWNHRVQKFGTDLRFITKWGTSLAVENSASSPGSFFGPRDVAVGPDNLIYVTDTGNKRIQVFSSDGSFRRMHGSAGSGPGQFMEPVGMAFSPAGEIYIADTWNRRIKVFGGDFTFIRDFPVIGWQGQGVENKPYIGVASNGDVFATDPSLGRVIRYTKDGATSAIIGGYDADKFFRTPTGVAVNPSGGIYISDASANTIVKLSP